MGVSITAPLAGNKTAHRGPPASLGLPAFLLIFCVCPWLAESKSWKGGACADLSLRACVPEGQVVPTGTRSHPRSERSDLAQTQSRSVVVDRASSFVLLHFHPPSSQSILASPGLHTPLGRPLLAYTRNGEQTHPPTTHSASQHHRTTTHCCRSQQVTISPRQTRLSTTLSSRNTRGGTPRPHSPATRQA